MVEYFGENPKTTQPSMFFPMFGRFIKAYKVRMSPRFLTFIYKKMWHCILIPLPSVKQTAQQEIQQKKKMESEMVEEKQSPSPNKPGVQKVR